MANGIGWGGLVALRVHHRFGRGKLWAMAFVTCLVPLGGLADQTAVKSDTTPPQARRIPFSDLKFLIEHNATDEDTGFQAFVDGEPWNTLTIVDPDHRPLLEIRAEDGLGRLGLTELFFETNEPENAEVPIEKLLAQFPEGRYKFEAQTVDGERMTGRATLSHTIPAGPEITAPAEGAVVDPNDTVVRWNPVRESITGSPVEIVGYEVIVTKAVDVHPPGFSKLVLSAHVSASTTSLTVPSEFLEPRTAYDLEVLALEVGGNQTISTRMFATN